MKNAPRTELRQSRTSRVAVNVSIVVLIVTGIATVLVVARMLSWLGLLVTAFVLAVLMIYSYGGLQPTLDRLRGVTTSAAEPETKIDSGGIRATDSITEGQDRVFREYRTTGVGGLRTVTQFRIDPRFLIPTPDADVDEAALDLVKALLTEGRLIYPEDRPLLTRELILDVFINLRQLVDKERLPADPVSTPLDLAINQAVAHRAAWDQAVDDQAARELTEEQKLYRAEMARTALRQVLGILLATLPVEGKRAEADLRVLIHDRDTGTFGLLFQHGTSFTVRMRHPDLNNLKAATEKVIAVLSPVQASELRRTIAKTSKVERISGRIKIDLTKPIEVKTPLGEVLQTGRIHAVGSPLRLLGFVATQAPQLYLLMVVIVLAIASLVLELKLLPGLVVEQVPVIRWLEDFIARLTTGAIGAYLVALFIRYGEIRSNLRSRKYGLRTSEFQEYPTEPSEIRTFILWTSEPERAAA